MGQLGEALQRPRRRGLDLEPTLQRPGLRIGVASLPVEPGPQLEQLRRVEPPGPRCRAASMASSGRPAPRAHSSQALQTGASASAPRQRLSQAPASSQRPASMASRALPSQTRSSSGASWPAFSRAALQALVRQPIQVEIAELLQVAGRILVPPPGWRGAGT